MQTPQILLLTICAVTFMVIGFLIYWGNNYSLNRIKNKAVGDGQHGTACFATKSEIKRTYKKISYTPSLWRQGKNMPVIQGLIVGCEEKAKQIYALIDTDDIHTLMIGASGVGKTANFLYPNIEYACACGMSFVATDTKGVRPDRVQ